MPTHRSRLRPVSLPPLPKPLVVFSHIPDNPLLCFVFFILLREKRKGTRQPEAGRRRLPLGGRFLPTEKKTHLTRKKKNEKPRTASTGWQTRRGTARSCAWPGASLFLGSLAHTREKRRGAKKRHSAKATALVGRFFCFVFLFFFFPSTAFCARVFGAVDGVGHWSISGVGSVF